MKTKIKYLFIFLGIMLIFPQKLNAQCSYERQAELSRIAANVKLSYSYDTQQNGYPTFTVNITNLTNDIYLVDNQGNTIIGQNEINKNYSSGDQIAYEIYSNDPNCKDEQLTTQYVNLPTFNRYSLKEECKDYPKFNYCQTWGNFGIVDFEFKRELEKYKKTLETNQITKTNEENFVVSIIKDNYLYIVIGIVLILIIFLFTRFKRIRR